MIDDEIDSSGLGILRRPRPESPTSSAKAVSPSRQGTASNPPEATRAVARPTRTKTAHDAPQAFKPPCRPKSLNAL